MIKYLTAEAGALGFRQWLIKHEYTQVMNPQPINLNNKHFHYLIKTSTDTFYCLFKHEPFYTFPQKYKEFFVKYPNLSSAGESINFDKLIMCMNNNYRLIFIYESGLFYEIDPITILNTHKLAQEFYPSGFIREQDKLNTYIDNNAKIEFRERTISFPLRSLARVLN
jgi:hypothetical protein